MRLVVVEDERSVGQVAGVRIVMQLRAGFGCEALGVELRVDRVGSFLSRMEVAPERGEACVVLAPAERARAVTGGERGRLVEEEQLCEPPRLQLRTAVPAAELQPARDPSPAVVMAPDPTARVVQAAAVSVDEPACGIGDELAERSDAVLKRHSAAP